MVLKRSVLIDQARYILQQPLQQLGFTFEPSPPVWSYEFWFEKRSKAVGEIFVIIEFQPDGFGANELFKTAINLYRLYRRSDRDGFSRKQPKGKTDQLWDIRLAPCLWDNSGKGAIDYWWDFASEADLQVAYQDALEKIIHYGIPFLENPKSTWLDALPDKLRMRYSKD